MTQYIKKGNVFRPQTKENLIVYEKLTADTFRVCQDPCTGEFFLEQIDNFDINHKLYGDTAKNSERMLATFQDRKNACTGILLTGEKGSGKTLLAKMISIQAREAGIPTLVVNQMFCGEAFNTFLQMIEQPVVVLFDEFEKLYQSTHQEKLLTLLDGIYPSQKLFLLTCNDKWRVNENMCNRPGRIYYMLDFDGLSTSFIREYAEDNLKDKGNIEQLVAISGIFRSFNFDMLKGMIEEMNRYNETPSEVLKFLNARPSFDLKQVQYVVKLKEADTDGGKEVVVYYQKQTGDKNRPRKSSTERFNANDLVGVNNDTGAYIFKNAKGTSAVLTPRKTEFEVNFGKLPTLRTAFNKQRTVSPTASTEKMVEDELPEEEDHAWAMDGTECESIGDY